MSVAVKRCVREHSRSEGNVRFLLFILADYTRKGSDFAFPSLRLLREELGVADTRSVTRIVRRAQKLGELVVEPGGGGRGGRSSDGAYRLTRYFVRCGIGSSHVADEEPRTVAQQPPLPPRSNSGPSATDAAWLDGGQT